MRNKSFYAFGVALLVILIAAGLGYAQSGRGTARLNGVVTDEDNRPVEGAQVTLSFAEAGGAKFEAKTDKKGEWSFMGLGSGRYDLAVVLKGYEPYAQAVQISQLSLNPKVYVKIKKIASVAGGDVIEDETSFEFLDKGNELYKNGQYDEAIAQYQLFLEKNPLAYQVELNIADAYREKGDYAKATELYNKIIDLSKTDATLGKDVSGKALAGIGDISLKENKLDEAQEYFRQSIERSPKDEVLAYDVGEIYFSNQNLDEAEKYFNLAIEIKPDWPDPYLKMGYVYLNKADNEAALKMFEKFLTLEPEGERAIMVKNIIAAIK